MTKSSIIVTGASGFVGKRFMTYNKSVFNLIPISLRKLSPEDVSFNQVNTVVHLAGLAHQMGKVDTALYYKVNSQLTIELARAAKQAGVDHFVFISTVKVYGDSPLISGFNLKTKPKPDDHYGKSKLQAELALLAIEDEKFKVSIIRPCLVYGPGVKGNILRLKNIINKGIPLPFKDIKNKRSMIYVDNLIELINKVIETKSTGTFLATDRQSVSTTELVKRMAEGLDKDIKLFRLPTLFRTIIKVLRPGLYSRLFESYIVDSVESYKSLDFIPPYSFTESIKYTVE